MRKSALLIASLCMAAVTPVLAQTKIENRLAASAEVLSQILGKPGKIPQTVLDRSVCVLVFPAVKKVGAGVGVSYGRGVIVCRAGVDMNGAWSAPSMSKLDVGSLGPQLGESSTDFVLLVESKAAAGKVLTGRVKLGAGASAVSGPTGATTITTHDAKADILTYSRAKNGLFAGVSLLSASLDSDDEANKRLYGKAITTSQIVLNGSTPIPPAARALVRELSNASPQQM